MYLQYECDLRPSDLGSTFHLTQYWCVYERACVCVCVLGIILRFSYKRPKSVSELLVKLLKVLVKLSKVLVKLWKEMVSEVTNDKREDEP